MKREFDWGMFFLYAFLVGILLMVCVGIVDQTNGQAHYYPGVVVSKIYKPSETSTGVSSGVDSKGKPVTTTTTQTSDEEWDIIVSTHGTTEKATTSPNRWAKIKEGDPIKVKETIGAIFHDLTDVRVE